jgi:polyisoprenoid-binding protein YceI
MQKTLLPLATALMILFIAACATETDTPAVTADTTASGELTLRAEGPVRLAIAPTGNEARYRVREQLVGLDFPNDAVGVTSDVTGAVVVNEDGSIDTSQSRIVVNVTGLTSDEERRDGYIQGRLLETEAYPSVAIRPTAFRGLSTPIPASGETSFEMLGDLTVRGVTRPTTWNVVAQFDEDQVTGSASTVFTFDEFQLTQPTVARVISIADTIRLEYDFMLNVEDVPAQ